MVDSGARTGPVLIGLGGKAGAGKNFIANRLMELHPSLNIWQGSFAGKLKDTVAVMFGVERGLMETNEGKQSQSGWGPDDPLTVRELLQWFGTEIVRDHIGKNFWVDALMKDVDRSKCDVFIVTDTRFANEAQAIKDRGGITCMVEGRAYENTPQHSSEAFAYEPTCHLYNGKDRPLADLDAGLKRLMAFARSARGEV
jgi:hypothetical protein